MIDVAKTVAAYNPAKASRSSVEGSFNRHVFSDGGELFIRRAFQEKLLGREWQLVRRIREADERKHTAVSHYLVGDMELIVRTLPPNYYHKHRRVGYKLEKVARILGKKVRIESPLMELSSSSGHRLIVTRKLDADNLNEAIRGSYLGSHANQVHLYESAGRIIAKLHAYGISHGHPHTGNWYITKHGSLALADSKYLQGFEPPTLLEVRDLINEIKKTPTVTPKNKESFIEMDLRHLVCHDAAFLKPKGINSILNAYFAAYAKEYSCKK